MDTETVVLRDWVGQEEADLEGVEVGVTERHLVVVDVRVVETLSETAELGLMVLLSEIEGMVEGVEALDTVGAVVMETDAVEVGVTERHFVVVEVGVVETLVEEEGVTLKVTFGVAVVVWVVEPVKVVVGELDTVREGVEVGLRVVDLDTVPVVEWEAVVVLDTLKDREREEEGDGDKEGRNSNPEPHT